MVPVWDVLFLFLLLESIHSLTPGLYTPVGNAVFEPILQCVSRYAATHLVLQLNIAADC